MPLTHIQLRAKEREAARAKPTPTRKPALERRLGAGPGPAIAGGPSYKPQPPSPLATGALAKPYFRPGAGSLAEALRAAEPVTGKGLDIQAQAWARREEILAERRGDAKGLYDRLLPLDDEGRKITLDAARQYKPEVVREMEREGYISPDGTLAEPEEVNKPIFKDTYTSEGWIHERTTFEDGTTTDEVIAPAPEEGVAAPTISEAVSLEKLGIAKEEHAERFRSQAIDIMGDMPRPGIDTLTIDGEEVIATAEHANSWIEGVRLMTIFLAGEGEEVPPEGELTVEDVKSMYEGRPDLISDVQQSLGVPVTGVWDEATEFAFGTYGDVLLAGEPTKEGEQEPWLNRFRAQPEWWRARIGELSKTFKGLKELTKYAVK